MRATVLCKETSKARAALDPVVAALRRCGFDAVDVPPFKKGAVSAFVTDPGDLVVAMGGDGTAAAVARALAHREVPLTIVPRGTANNVARCLEVPFDTAAWTRGFEAPVRGALDLGKVTGPWGEREFVEGAGVGLFHQFLSCRADDDGKDELQALRGFRDTLASADARPWQLRVDGVDRSGEYLLVEVMNTPFVGFHIALGGAADPTDGLLDVVLVGERERDALHRYLDARIGGDGEAPLPLPRLRARRVDLLLPQQRIRVDDQEWPEHEPEEAAWITLEVEPSAVPLWLPRGEH